MDSNVLHWQIYGIWNFYHAAIGDHNEGARGIPRAECRFKPRADSDELLEKHTETGKSSVPLQINEPELKLTEREASLAFALTVILTHQGWWLAARPHFVGIHGEDAMRKFEKAWFSAKAKKLRLDALGRSPSWREVIMVNLALGEEGSEAFLGKWLKEKAKTAQTDADKSENLSDCSKENPLKWPLGV